MNKEHQLLEVVQFSALSCLSVGLIACTSDATAFDLAFIKAFRECSLTEDYPLSKLTLTPSKPGERSPSNVIERAANGRAYTYARPSWGYTGVKNGRIWLTPTEFHDDDWLKSYMQSNDSRLWVEEWISSGSNGNELETFYRWQSFGTCFSNYLDEEDRIRRS